MIDTKIFFKCSECIVTFWKTTCFLESNFFSKRIENEAETSKHNVVTAIHTEDIHSKSLIQTLLYLNLAGSHWRLSSKFNLI